MVLVEGDTDTFTFPHLAKLINPDWDDVNQNITFIKINGKGNIKRYKGFFKRFEVPVHVIADLDALLEGFGSLTDSRRSKAARDKMLNLVNQHLDKAGIKKERKTQLHEFRNPSSSEILAARDELLTSLAEEFVYVLKRGDIEVYSGTNAEKDKLNAAIKFCEATTSRDDLCELHGDDADGVIQELTGIFERIYK